MIRAVFVDDQNNFAALPSALRRESLPQTPVDSAHPGSGFQDDGETDNLNTAPTEAEQRAHRDTEGLVALCRAMTLIKAKSPDWTTVAAAARDQYATETGDSLEVDLFAAFADA